MLKRECGLTVLPRCTLAKPLEGPSQAPKHYQLAGNSHKSDSKPFASPFYFLKGLEGYLSILLEHYRENLRWPQVLIDAVGGAGRMAARWQRYCQDRLTIHVR